MGQPLGRCRHDSADRRCVLDDALEGRRWPRASAAVGCALPPGERHGCHRPIHDRPTVHRSRRGSSASFASSRRTGSKSSGPSWRRARRCAATHRALQRRALFLPRDGSWRKTRVPDWIDEFRGELDRVITDVAQRGRSARCSLEHGRAEARSGAKQATSSAIGKRCETELEPSQRRTAAGPQEKPIRSSSREKNSSSHRCHRRRTVPYPTRRPSRRHRDHPWRWL